jgi:hypothetical protein
MRSVRSDGVRGATSCHGGEVGKVRSSGAFHSVGLPCLP